MVKESVLTMFLKAKKEQIFEIFFFQTKNYGISFCSKSSLTTIVCFFRWSVPVDLTSLSSKDHLKIKLRASIQNRSSFLLSTLPIFKRSIIVAFIISSKRLLSLFFWIMKSVTRVSWKTSIREILTNFEIINQTYVWISSRSSKSQ